jgi:aryl sulfotransferase
VADDLGKLIVIASYPKSGSTWLRALVTSLQTPCGAFDVNNLGVRNCADRRWCGLLLGISTGDLIGAEVTQARRAVCTFAARRAPGDLWIKIHDAWLAFPGSDLLPLDPDDIAAVIYMARDPRDVAVSFASHLSVSVEDVIGYMDDSQFRLGDSGYCLNRNFPQLLSTWSVHVSSWLTAFAGRIHVLRYEDALRDPLRFFADAMCLAGVQANAAALGKAVEATAFERLSALELSQGFRESAGVGSRRFFRSGVAEGWKGTLTSAQARRVFDAHSVVMKQLGYAS